MKKQILTIIIILISSLTFACSCDEINPIMEFYSSEYVFEGKIISKVYANDSLTYKVTFDISKHYKNGDLPKKLEFVVFSKGRFNSEGKYIGIGSNCDSYPEKGEIWLIYAKKYKGKLHFPNICSNSKNTDYRQVRIEEQKVLENGNSFKLENFIYQFEHDFNYTKPIYNIDSILKTGQIKDYEKPFTWLKLYVDKNGNLNSVTTHIGYQLKTDSIFNLPNEFKIKLRKPLTEFEKDAIELVKKVRKWEIKKHRKTNVSVPYIRHLAIEFDKEKKEWKYEL
jgi:thiol-disulfide isomerase/thioredoxin